MRLTKIIPSLLFVPLIANAKSLPNVIIIIADDIGYGDLDWLGSTTIKTPNINKLAREGLCFTNFYASSATSTPSRFGLLTGIYPWRQQGTNIAQGDAAMVIKPNQFTMADMFQSAGYETAAIGKWHLGLGAVPGEQNWNGYITPNLYDIGFNYSYIMAATADRVPCVYIENGHVVGADSCDSIFVSYTTPFKEEPTGKSHPELLRLKPSHGHNDAIINGVSRIGFMKGGNKALWKDEDIADNITNKVTEFINKQHDKPFFMYFGTNDIHVPRLPNSRFIGKSGMGVRGDAILSFDYCVGRIMEMLDSVGIANNTVLIVTSDNGPVLDDGYNDFAEKLLGEHKPAGELRGGKYSIFEAGTRVPCIVRWPDRIKHGRTSALFSNVDLISTLSKIIESNVPDTIAIDSKCQINAFIGKSLKGRKFLIEHNAANTLSIVTSEWKYIESSDGMAFNINTKIELGNDLSPQLYNLRNDASEKNNVISQFPKQAAQLQKWLSNEKKMVSKKN